MGGKYRPPHPPEFRAEAIVLVRSSGKSRRVIAHDPGVSTATLWQWIEQTYLDAGVRQDGLTTCERGKARLRRSMAVHTGIWRGARASSAKWVLKPSVASELHYIAVDKQKDRLMQG